MLFELARSVFHKPVEWVLQNVSNDELMHWFVLQSVDPSGEARADLRDAITASAFVNTQVTKKKDLTKPKDFLAGELLRKQHRKSAAQRGIITDWDARKFWQNFKAKIGK